MLKKILCLLALLNYSFLSAQKIPKTENICFFKDAKTGLPITIIDDSLVYKGSLKNPTVLKHTNYPESLENYSYHFIIQDHNYLVNEGCGPVVEYRNDSIVRIDNSFSQKNQFGASPFVFNNQIHLFGGWGLFTFKNIITKFDFNTNEWFEYITKSNEKPSPRHTAMSILIDNVLYVFDGFEKEKNSNNDTIPMDEKIWCLNLKTAEWKNIGNNLNEKFKKTIKSTKLCFQANNKLYIINPNIILEIDLLNNKICFYKNNSLFNVKRIYFDNSTNSLLTINHLTGVNKLVLNKIPLTSFIKNPIKTESFYYSKSNKPLYYSISVFFILLAIIIVFKKTNKQLTPSVQYKKNKIYYKTKIINNLDSFEEKILIYLYKNNNQFIQLNQLNYMFENDKLDNFSATVKKRDIVINNLFFKISSILNVEEGKLLLIQKNEKDKRIKEIKLNPLYFSIK